MATNDFFSSDISTWATDFFNDMVFQEQGTLQERETLQEPNPPPQQEDESHTVHEKPCSPVTNKLDRSHHAKQIILWLQDMLHTPEPVQKWFIVFLYGKRRIPKTAIPTTQLTITERNIYNFIKQELQLQERKDRVEAFMKDKKISKRLISYFIVHYVAIHPTCYYLDRSSYPYRIIGSIGPSMAHLPRPPPEYDQKPVLFINLYVEYHKCLSYRVPQKCNAPYSRKNIVKDDTTEEGISLSAIPYYLWLDNIGGMEAFLMLKDDVKKSKKEYEATKLKLKGTREKLRLYNLLIMIFLLDESSITHTYLHSSKKT
jgi:hypothetical protein